MKLPFNNENIFEPHKSLIERGNPLIYSIDIYIYTRTLPPMLKM